MRPSRWCAAALPYVNAFTFTGINDHASPGESLTIAWRGDNGDPDVFFLCLGPSTADGPINCKSERFPTASGSSTFAIPDVSEGFYRFYAAIKGFNVTTADVIGSSNMIFIVVVGLPGLQIDDTSSSIMPFTRPSQISLSIDTSSTSSDASSSTHAEPTSGTESAGRPIKGGSLARICTIVGAVLGTLVVVALAAAFVWFRWRRRSTFARQTAVTPYPLAPEPIRGTVAVPSSQTLGNHKLTDRLVYLEDQVRQIQQEMTELEQLGARGSLSESQRSNSVAHQVELLRGEMARIATQLTSSWTTAPVSGPPPCYVPGGGAEWREC